MSKETLENIVAYAVKHGYNAQIHYSEKRNESDRLSIAELRKAYNNSKHAGNTGRNAVLFMKALINDEETTDEDIKEMLMIWHEEDKL